MQCFLIEIEENICDTSLTFINQVIHLKKREEVLTQLGRRAKSGDNRFNRFIYCEITNEPN